MLQLRPNCEACDVDIPADSLAARICSFECAFRAEVRFDGACPNCGGELLRPAIGPVAAPKRFPGSSERVIKAHQFVGHSACGRPPNA